MANAHGQQVIVVGGGVVGIACALTLQREGYSVTIVERELPGESTAAASCGSIAVSEIIPLARPGILLKAPGWLLSPKGPLSVRPASIFGLLPWFLRFVANARSHRILEISKGLASLTIPALTDWEKLLQPLGLNSLIGHRPVLELYDSESEFEAERIYHEHRRSLGFQIDEISGQEAVEIEPAIARDFAKAVVFNNWRTIADNKGFLIELTRAFTNAGGIVLQTAITGFFRQNGCIRGVITSSGKTLNSDIVVLAAGAWSKTFESELGCKMMIEGILGYQTLISDPGFSMEHAVVYAKGGFGITPYENGLAVGGTIEFADLDSTPNWKRAGILVEKSKRVLPHLKNTNGDQRVGRRPMTPDTLPIIDRAPMAENVLVATGHGQLGITTAATTGKLVAALASQRTPEINLKPYSINRF